jgi:hypothetical protein
MTHFLPLPHPPLGGSSLWTQGASRAAEDGEQRARQLVLTGKEDNDDRTIAARYR